MREEARALIEAAEVCTKRGMETEAAKMLKEAARDCRVLHDDDRDRIRRLASAMITAN